MVLILSSAGDLSTELVMDWLRHYQHPFIRINSHDLLDKAFSMALSPAQLTIDSKVIKVAQINAVWFRKFGFFKKSKYYQHKVQHLEKGATTQIHSEYQALLRGFTALFQDKYWLNSPQTVAINKIQALNMALKCGLNTPATYVVNTRQQVETLASKHSLISKSVYEPFFLNTSKGTYSMYTKEITQEVAGALPQHFYPSLVQSKIEKMYELRVFYLEGDFYAMAIFSQQDTQTALDFRQYNHKVPNRKAPYCLPPTLKERLHQLMQKLEINCGSIDIIRGVDQQYYFLEINPVGQFGMTSIPCNYDLHQIVAQHLLNKDLTHGTTN